MVFVMVVVTIIAFLTIDYLVNGSAEQRALAAAGASVGESALAATALGEPADLSRLPMGVFHAPGHTWVHLESSGDIRLGAGGLPLRALGGIDRVEMRRPGAEVHVGDTVAVLGRGDREVRLRSPVEGTVAAVNATVRKHPGRLEADCPDRSWLYQIRPRRLSDSLRRMYVGEEANEWMGKEIGRLRDCMAAVAVGTAEPSATLADGGLPVNGLAAAIGVDEWRELAAQFFEESAPDISTNQGRH